MDTRSKQFPKLTAFSDFFALLARTPENRRLSVVVSRLDRLKELICSVNRLFDFFEGIDADIKKTIIESHPHILLGAFNQVDDITKFWNGDANRDFDLLTKDENGVFTQHLLSLFKSPDDVLNFIRPFSKYANGRRLLERAQHLFDFAVPFASELIFSKKYLDKLRPIADVLVDRVVTSAMAQPIQQIDVELVIQLAKFNVMYRNELLTWFSQVINAKEHSAVIDEFLRPDNFESLFRENKLFAKELYKRRSLIDILFDGQLTRDKLASLVGNRSPLVEEVLKVCPAEVDALFQSTEDVRDFSYLEAFLRSYLNKQQVAKIQRLFFASKNLDDWLWLARHTGPYNTELAGFLFNPCVNDGDAQCRVALRAVFPSSKELIEVTTLSPYFSSLVIEQLKVAAVEQYTNANPKQVVEPVSLFSDPAVFVRFLKAGGKNIALRGFVSEVCRSYPNHINVIVGLTEASRDEESLDFLNNLINYQHGILCEKIIEVFEASGKFFNVLSRLPNFKTLLEHDSLKNNPDRLVKLVKTPSDLIMLVKSDYFKQDYISVTHAWEYVNRRLSKYIQSPDCHLPALMRSFLSPGKVLADLRKERPLFVEMLIEYHPSLKEKPDASLPSIIGNKSLLLSPPTNEIRASLPNAQNVFTPQVKSPGW